MSLFGTDGIRAPFGRPPLDRATVTALGTALGTGLVAAADGDAPRVALGGDTRDSTPRLAAWIAAGLRRGGARPEYAGVLPTPGVSWLVRRLSAAAGVAISASHNPHPDNGIKLFDGGGFKWSAGAERALEGRLASLRDGDATEPEPPQPERTLDPALYVDGLAATLPGERPLGGLRVALDTGNGAASAYAGELFTRLGAEPVTLGDRPDGTNINAGCGSTHPGPLARRVAAGGCDLGLAFDGDADRVVPVDESGGVRDGDAVLYLWARALAKAGALEPRRIVVTSMSNLGLERALARHRIGVVRCEVGDRAVVATMRREGAVLGGEQSGHVVHLGLSTTGDGLLTAIQLAALVHRAERPLSELLAGFERYPQVLENVRVARKPDLASLPQVAGTARAVTERLGSEGRLVLRYSGTEPLARIMIEGPDEAVIHALAGELAAAIAGEIGAET